MRNQECNYSQITRQALYKDLLAELSFLVHKPTEIKVIQQALKKFFYSRFNFRVVNRRMKKVEKDIIYVGGCYRNELDQEHLPSIEIQFFYTPKLKKCALDAKSLKRFAIVTVDTILHEIIHMRQYRSRNFKEIPGYKSTAYSSNQRREQNYLGDRDEIGAYAFNLACELWDKFGQNHNRSIQWLDTDDWKRDPKNTFYTYMVTFDGDHNHKVIKKLKTQTKKYLPNYDVDKPFRTTKYLTY